MDKPVELPGYQRFEFAHEGRTRTVYRKGTGPAVIVIHEMPGLHPLVLRFADRVAEAGMTVFCPSLFGEPGRPVSAGYALGELARGCVRAEFAAWATDRSSPIVDWLRALARKAHGECGGNGVGAVGMCFTGGFALAMMTDPAVVAPVLSQPSLPLPFGSQKRAAAIGASPREIACVRQRLEAEDLSIIGLRFFRDPFVPDARFKTYRTEFGTRFEAIEIDPKDAAPGPGPPHSVLTIHLNEDGPTKAAERRVIEFFRQRTGADA
ncbi:MAG: dienelactone hydrolase family protein [Phenylobacterium sp.]|nr:dienelactone hydrolase family protein [Phenylobacterium sp.]